MTSNDIRVLATDEQAFRVYVITKFDGTDKRLDGMDKRLDGMDKRLDGMDKRLDALEEGQKELRAEVKVLAENQAALSTQISRLDSRMDMSLWVMGIGFSLLTVFIGFIGVFVPLFLNRKKEEAPAPAPAPAPVPIQPLTYDNVQDMIDRAFKLQGR